MLISEELSEKGRLLVVGNVLVVILMFLVAFYYYLILPEVIPTHFSFGGKPDRYGSKDWILIMPFLFSMAQITILILTRYRFRTWKLLNVPIDLNKLDEKKRVTAINRYFEFLLMFSLELGLCLLLLEIGMFECIKMGKLALWFYLLLIPIFLLIIPYAISYSKLNEKLKREIGL